MSEENQEAAGETPPDPPKKTTKMVNVVNTHRFRSFHLGGGSKIGPGQTGRIPAPMFNKVKDTISWIKRAERGDVV